MTAEPETATTRTYELTCTDCQFETVVEGSPFDALDVAESHEQVHGDVQSGHFVNLVYVDE